MFERRSRQQPADRAPAADNAITAEREPDGPGGLGDQLYTLLHEVIDPEIGINIVTSGWSSRSRWPTGGPTCG